jgi:8-oxo-dGTP pyrophosphatase MutT (NUDIX family)
MASGDDPSTGDDPEVRAAGGVVWRRDDASRGGTDSAGRVEVLLVHRPRYDDWSFPKGKLDAGEGFEGAALREVEEETGVRATLGAELPTIRYVDNRGRDKVVRYWAMTPVAEREWAPGDEIDDVRWVPLADAASLLTYRHDRALLAAFEPEPPTAHRT